MKNSKIQYKHLPFENTQNRIKIVNKIKIITTGLIHRLAFNQDRWTLFRKVKENLATFLILFFGLARNCLGGFGFW